MSFLHNDPSTKNFRRVLRIQQTKEEALLWHFLRARQFHGLKFFRQFSIGKYILDFYCHEKKLAIELDGGQHNEESGIVHDIERTDFLNAQGIHVLRFWNSDIHENSEGVLERIAQEITPPAPSYEEGVTKKL